MELIKNKIRKIKDKQEHLRREVKEKTIGYILAALGFVIGLAWNDAVKSLIEYLFPINTSGIFAKLFYALFVTVFAVIITVYFLTSSEGGAEKK